jgi:hypothetical protein
MNKFAKTFTLTACALAASVLISACGGGGETTDTVAPSVVISASALNSGVMTFSFVFSKDVGTSFAVEDLLISGGTAGVLTKTNATTYSLPITPTGAAGTISVSLAAAKYTDLANKPNTSTASKSEAFDTTTGPGTPVLTFDESSGIALSAFSGGTLTIDAGPDGGVGKVGKLVRQGGDTAGAGKVVLNAKIPFTADSKKMTVRVWSSKANVPIILKVEGEAGAAVDAPAINVTAANTWQTMTFDFGAVDLSKNYNVVVLMPDTGVVGTGQVYYFDEITLVGASTGTPSTPTATEPTTAAATPVVAAANVLSIYSDAYTPIAGVNLRPDWGQPTVVSEVLVAGNKTQKYTAFTYEGITFTPINATAMTKLHIDVWTPDLTALDVFVLAGGAEQFVTVTPTKAGWNSFDIDLSAYTTLNKATVKELKLVAKGGSTLYFDNLYFTGAASGTTETVQTGGSGATANCVDSATVKCLNFTGTSVNPRAWDGGVVATISADPADATNSVLKMIKAAGTAGSIGAVLATAAGDTWVLDSASPGEITSVNKTITMRVYSAAIGEKIMLKIAGINVVGTAQEVTQTTTKANAWETLTFTYNTATKFDQLAVFGDYGSYAAGGANPQKTFYFDEVSYPKGAALNVCSTVPGLAALTAGKFASGYVGVLDSGTSTECGTFGKYDGGMDLMWYDGGVAGSAADPSFYFGYGALTTSVTSDSYFGAFVKAPKNGTANVSGFTKVNVTTWGWAGLAKANPTGTVVLKGANVGTCAPTYSTTFTGLTNSPKVFSLNLSSFTAVEACGITSVANFLAGGINEVHVQYIGSNVNKTQNIVAGRAENGMHLGIVTFGN